MWRVGSSFGNSAAPDATSAVADANDADWTLSLKPATVERHNVEADVIAACRGLTHQQPDLTSASRNRPRQRKPRQPRPPVEPNAEICVAQVLASLSGGSVDHELQVPATTSSSVVSAKNARRRQTSTRKNAKIDNAGKNNNWDNWAAGDDVNAELSTINMSDIDRLSLPVHLSPIPDSVSKRPTTGSTISSLPSSVARSVTVSSCVTQVVNSSKHSFYRPMKQSLDVNITYDETTKRYVQTLRKSCDRRKFLGFPGFQSDAGDSSCRRSLPIAVAVGSSAETKENEAIDAAADNQRRRLSPRRDGVTSVSSSSLACDESATELSSMETVTRCCLGTSETQTVEEQSRPSQAANTTDVSSDSRRARIRRAFSLPAREASNCLSNDSELMSVTSKSSTADMTTSEKVEPSASLSVSTSSSGATKNNTKVKKVTAKDRLSVDSAPMSATDNSSMADATTTEKVEPSASSLSVSAGSSGATKNNTKVKNVTAKDRPAKKRSEKVPSRTSPRNSKRSPVGSAEWKVTKKQRGRPRVKKPPTEISKEKKCGRKGKATIAVDPQVPTTSACVVSTKNTSPPIRRRQTAARKSDKVNNNSDNWAASSNRSAELSTINISDVNGLGPVHLSSVAVETVEPANNVSKRPTAARKGRATKRSKSPLETPSHGSGSVTQAMKRKRRSDSVGVNAETAHGCEEQPVKNTVRLPDIECFLAGPSRSGEKSANPETVMDLRTSKNFSDTADSGLPQNRCPSNQATISAASSTDTVMPEEKAEHLSPPTDVLPPSTTSLSVTQMSSTVCIPQSPSLMSASARVSEHSTDDVHCPTVSNVGCEERPSELISGQSSGVSVEKERPSDLISAQTSGVSVENNVNVANATHLSGQCTCLVRCRSEMLIFLYFCFVIVSSCDDDSAYVYYCDCQHGPLAILFCRCSLDLSFFAT